MTAAQWHRCNGNALRQPTSSAGVGDELRHFLLKVGQADPQLADIVASIRRRPQRAAKAL
jgi:hypothetical protein